MLEQSLTGPTYTRDPTSSRQARMLPYAETPGQQHRKYADAVPDHLNKAIQATTIPWNLACN